MALSFGESKKKAQSAKVNSSIANFSMNSISAPVAVFADTMDDDFVKSELYTWFDSYDDDDYSVVDSNKNITLSANQVNLTQESNSQVIPFEMPRFYDGIDLMSMTIQIHYVNANGEENYSAPINVHFSSSKIRFYWLVSDKVTVKDGTIRFEIIANGAITVPNTDITKKYMWRTKASSGLNVLKALEGKGMVDPTGEDWYTEFLATMSQRVGEAQVYSQQAKASAEQAQKAAESVDAKISNAADSIKQELTDNLNANFVQKTALETTLQSYYTKQQIDDIKTSLTDEINSIDGLAEFKVKYDSDTNTLTFLNGEQELYKIVLSTDPSAEWVSTYGKTVDSKIETAISGVRDDLNSYKETNDKAVQELTKNVGNLPETLQSDYYNKSSIDGFLNDKADKTSVETINNEVTVVKKTAADIQGQVDAANEDITALQEKVNNLKPDENSGREYDITYSDSKLSLLENGQVKTQVVIEGGGGGGGSSSVITIERLNGSALTVISGNFAIIEFKFTSLDNSGDDTGSATGTWYVGNTKVATQTIVQGKNTFDVTQYLKSGDNNIKLSVTDSVGSIGTKNWSANVIEFYLDSSFDDSLVYSGEVTFRYTPYGNIAKTITFTMDGKKIGEVTSSATGRQMVYTIPAQKHGSHLLEVKMTAMVNNETVTSNVIRKDIIWASEGEQAPIISCANLEYTAKQYSTVSISYTVYDPTSSNTKIMLAVDGVKASTLTVGRTMQVWSFKSGDIGLHTLTITCGDTVKTIHVKIEALGIEIEPVKTNLAFDFNPSGKTNAGEDRLWTDGNTSLSVSENFDWSNGGYQIDSDGDTYFCVKAGTTATIDYKLFADDAKKLGKNFKLIFKTTNVKNYDATSLTCVQGGIGLNVQAQKITLTSEQNSIELPICEDDFSEFEFNILPDSQYKEMVLWMDGIPCRVELYDSNDNFTQPNPVKITIGSADCDVQIYRMKSYMMNLTDDEILDNFIADAKNAELMVDRYNRNNITNVSGELDPDLLAEKCPDLRVIKISAPTFTTGKKNEVSDTIVQQIYKHGRPVDNWTATGSHKGQGTSSNAYGESGRNIDINCSGGFEFSDGSSDSKYALTENSVPEKYFNIKVNIASSENANNALLADDYNEFNPYVRKAKKENPKVRDTMAFYPCVIFIQETDTENATVFNDGQWHFYACGDIGNSKKNSDTMGMNPENHKEVIIEIDNNTDEQTRFLSGDFSNETWDGNHSFEFRYINPDCTDEEIQAAKNAWINVQNWVVNADDEEFKNHFEDHFVKNSALYFYLFTERHTMVDNRAKNVFPHTEDLIHWDFCFDYDNDTAQGNDNEGGLTLTYGYEDTDTIGTKSVFNANDSKLWCKIRDLFQDDLRAMYLNRESALAWNANRILKKFEDYQDVKPEKLWIMDMRRKYFRTYEDNGTTSYLPMMHGNKRHQRRQFQRYQEKYIASKYSGTTATADDMTIRGYTPENWKGVKPDGTFHIVPYADTYVSVLYGSNPVKMRGKRGQTYEVKCPIAAMNDTEVYVYNASIMQSIGDISGFYPGYVDFSHGVKLTDLHIGAAEDGYANTNLTDFAVGNNTLLERLNLQNVPNLKKSISLTGCTNLEEFLADGSGITGVSFANGGKIKTAHLPAIASLSAKNLNFLTDFTIEKYDNITTLTIENCPTIDLKEMLDKCSNLNRIRLVGVKWNLDDTSLLDRLLGMAGIDENGYNTETSVVEGTVFVPIIREKQLADYTKQWPDLKITYSTLVEQFKWTFVNKDGSILDVQYIDKGGKAVDPVKRKDNPIAVPTMKSTVSTDFTFSGWDTEFITVFGNQTVTATYTESVRNYTIRYLVKGVEKFKKVAPYGSTVLYEGDMPQYTAEESAYKYNLFKNWDKGGFVDGDKDINAVFDSFEYSSGCFDGMELSDMTPVQIYAMDRVGVEQTIVEEKDPVIIEFGKDFHYDDIEEKVIFDSEKKFDGKTYVDTGVKLFDTDKDFVLAIDYKVTSEAAVNSVIAQCFETNGMNGFRIWNNSGMKVTWGTDSCAGSSFGLRDLVVLRHIKGENGLRVYASHPFEAKSFYIELARTRKTSTEATLVFGCAKADDGAYENYATGSVYWSKIWYADLGDSVCKQLVSWPHEKREFELCGFKRFYLSDGSNKRSSMTFIAKDTLGSAMMLSDSSDNAGGWAKTKLKDYLDTRLLEALPVGWQQLIKQVRVASNAGSKNSEIVTSDSYFFIPSVAEISPSMATEEPYVYEGSPISFMTDNESRAKTKPDGTKTSYWTRSPNASYNSYYYNVSENGDTYGYIYPTEEHDVVLMFCI